MTTPERTARLHENTQLQLAAELVDRGLFGIFEDSEETITLKSGRLSPHYLDMRPGISSQDFRRLIAWDLGNLAACRASEVNESDAYRIYDHIAGTPEAMTSYTPGIADALNISLLQPRVDMTKKSGNKTPILGKFEPGQTVAAFDDVVTDGQSKVDTIAGFSAAGLTVKDYFVVIDREEGGAPHVYEATGIMITPALGVSSMVRMLRADGRINQAQFDNVARYLDQYGEPHARETMHTAL